MDRVDVWVIRFSLPVASTVQALATSFEIDEERARVYATSAPIAVKHGASLEAGRRYVRLLETVGAEVQLVPAGTVPAVLVSDRGLASLPPPPRPASEPPPRSSSLPPPRSAPPPAAATQPVEGAPVLVDVWVLQFSGDRDATIEGLQRVFGVTAEKAERYADAAPLPVKHGVAHAVGRGFGFALATIGAKVELVPVGAVPASVAAGWPAMPTGATPAPAPVQPEPERLASLPPPPSPTRPPPAAARPQPSAVAARPEALAAARPATPSPPRPEASAAARPAMPSPPRPEASAAARPAMPSPPRPPGLAGGRESAAQVQSAAAVASGKRPRSTAPAAAGSGGGSGAPQAAANAAPPAPAPVAASSGIAGTLDVWVTGFQVSVPEAVIGLCRVFGLPDAEARLIASSVPAAVKLGLEWGQAAEYAKALRTAGAVVQVVPSGHRPVPG